jgi:polyisoprenoid-binding protein YceI
MALLVLAATAAGAVEEPDPVLIRYELKMGTRQIAGVSHDLEIGFEELDGERAGLRARVPIDSFDSGHPDFDSIVRKAIDSEHHPFAQIEGIARQGRLDGTLELAGVVRPVTVRLRTERVAGNLIAVASFAIDLRDHGVEIAGVDPHVSVDVIVLLASGPQAVRAALQSR